MMNNYLLVLFLILLTSCSSTQKAWSTYEPNEYLYVISDGVDPEPALKEGKLKYYCKNTLSSSDNLNKSCYVEKTLSQKTTEFTYSLARTPVAVVIDVARTIVVVGKVTLIALLSLNPDGYHN